MVIEPIIALVIALLLSLTVRAYLRWVHTDAGRHPEFDAWVASTPLVFAAKCQPGHEPDVYDALRGLFGPYDALANREGGFPWQHYGVRLDYRHLPGDVVGLVITDARLQRGTQRLPDLSVPLAGLGPVAAHIEEVWLHGQLHGGGRPTKVDRDRTGWVGTVDANGAFDVSPQIGEPEWLAASA